MNIREIISYVNQYDKNDEDYLNKIFVEVQNFCEERLKTFQQKFDSVNNFYRYKRDNFNNSLIKLIKSRTPIEEAGLDLIYCYEHLAFELIDESEVINTTNNDTICSEAYDDHYFTCDSCEEIDHIDNERQFNNYQGIYCESCYDNQGYNCERCDEYMHENENCDCDHDEDYNEDSDYLDNYRTRVFLAYLVLTEGTEIIEKLFYGIEVELHARDDRYDTVEELRDCFNNDQILFKQDGSLDTQQGFEVVSTNCSFEYHKEVFWKSFFKKSPNNLCKAWHGKDCGLHIHFSREAFTTNQIRRLNCFYNNSENRKLIVDIAGRDENQYCRFQPNRDFNSPIKTQGEKYSVINLDNRDTIEIRIFRSNIKQISFFKYLEFVHSVNSWIRAGHQNNGENLLWTDYMDYLLKNIHKDYSNLLVFLDDKKYFDHLENIETWQPIYEEFKSVVEDFRINNELLIQEGVE